MNHPTYYPDDYFRDLAVTIYALEKNHDALNAEAEDAIKAIMLARGISETKAKLIVERATVDYIDLDF
jgi:hypothetical protein